MALEKKKYEKKSNSSNEKSTNNSKKQSRNSSNQTLVRIGVLEKYETSVIDVDFSFTGNGLRKSMNSQVSDYGSNLDDLSNAVLNLQDLLDNVVLLKTHSDKAKKENSRLKQLENNPKTRKILCMLLFLLSI